ncbi:MAG: hypothetical protein NVS4B12_02710 [Ktedonobacteraceae bacterium]
MQTETQNRVRRHAEESERLARRNRPVGPQYKWVALTNTTIGVLMATIDSSIVLISLPVIFKGIHINPLAPGETGYFLWMLLGYMVVTATLLVTFGRISDMFGRVRFYNLGFLIFTIGSILLWLTPSTGNVGALELILYLSLVMCLLAALASLLRGKAQNVTPETQVEHQDEAVQHASATVSNEE